MDDIGRVNIILDRYLKEHNVSRSSLSREGEIYYKQVKKYCDNDMQKVDLLILAKMCKFLKCNIQDILEYQES